MEEKLILISNDDGYKAEGLHVLKQALSHLGKVVAVAPMFEMSASSHAVTLQKAISYKQISEDIYAVDGTPVDCVLIAIFQLLKTPPAIVVSGINKGANLGEDVFYSGTVAAAREASLYGIPGVAVSTVYKDDEDVDFHSAGVYVKEIIKRLFQLPPTGFLLNINIPNMHLAKIKGTKITRLSSRRYEDPVIGTGDHFVIGGKPVWRESPGTDITAIREGYVSITPLLTDITDYKAIEKLEKLKQRANL